VSFTIVVYDMNIHIYIYMYTYNVTKRDGFREVWNMLLKLRFRSALGRTVGGGMSFPQSKAA